MVSALIGHTGFVGSNLLAQAPFEARFNSRNFRDMAGQRFDLVVCAGISAVKWQANRDPEGDRARIAELEAVLERVEAARFVLISTVDVYPDLSGTDEAWDCHQADNHAYGRNRLAFEDFVAARFPAVHVLRLPGLYGPGLKKNVIFDLMHDNCLGAINPDSAFQWYGVHRLWRDVEAAIAAGLPLANLMTEPVRTGAIIDRLFPGKPVGAEAGAAVRYDVHTRHAEAFGGAGAYVESAAGVLDGIAAYVAADKVAEAGRGAA